MDDGSPLTWEAWLFPDLSLPDSVPPITYPIIKGEMEEIPTATKSHTTSPLNNLADRTRLPYKTLHEPALAMRMMEDLRRMVRETELPVLDTSSIPMLKRFLRNHILTNEATTTEAGTMIFNVMKDVVGNPGLPKICQKLQEYKSGGHVKMDRIICQVQEELPLVIWEDKSWGAFNTFAKLVVALFRGDKNPFTKKQQENWKGAKSIIAKVCCSSDPAMESHH
jgi:hypothetical protein